MDKEKDFLKKDLENAETKEAVEDVKESAELLGHEDIVALAQQKLDAILLKVVSVETTLPSQVAQVESMGGLSDEIKKRTESIDKKIDEVRDDAVVKIGEVKGESVEPVDQPPVSTISENQKAEEPGEKTPEQIEVEKLKAEMETVRANYQELARKKDVLGGKIQEIKIQKGYARELEVVESKRVPPEQILSSVLPNKRTGLENLNKILAATSHESDKDRVRKLIRKVESLSEQDVKDLSSNLAYEWREIRATNLINDSVGFSDLGKVTGSEEVKNIVSSREGTNKKVAEIEDKIQNDPDISANENLKAELVRQLAVEEDKISRLQDKIQSLEQSKT